MAHSKAPTQFFLLQLMVGLFFVFLGILGILPQAEEGFFSLTHGGRMQIVELLVGVVELSIGVILLLGLFQFLTLKILSMATFWAFVLWVIRIVVSQVVFGLGLANGVIVLTNMTPNWWLGTLLMLVLASNLWTLHRRYAVA